MSRSTEISAVLAAVRERHRDAGDRDQLRAQRVDRRRRTRVCSGRVGLDRPSCTTGMLEAEYLMISGGVMPGGSWRTCVCIDRHHLRDRGLDVGGRLEEDLDDRDAGERCRLDVLDVAHRGGQAALALPGDALRPSPAPTGRCSSR